MFPIGPVGVSASAVSGNRRSEVGSGRKSSSTNWWSPLFGWSADPDYIDSDDKKNDLSVISDKNPVTDQDQKPSSVKSRLTPGSFTEEKAKQLRMMMTETSTFHDVMYHSAIASRLASDFTKNRSDR